MYQIEEEIVSSEGEGEPGDDIEERPRVMASERESRKRGLSTLSRKFNSDDKIYYIL